MLTSVIILGLCQASLQATVMPGSFMPIQPDLTTDSYVKPVFCHELDCPRYKLLESNDKFELRKYEPSVWVATEVYVFDFTDAVRSSLFWKLFQYISGNNSLHSKIPMTAPVITEIVHGPGPDCESNFTMHFMMPFDLQSNPPTPTEDSVFIETLPEMTVYVKSYGGYSTNDRKRMNIEELVNDLQNEARPYKDAMYYTAGYDGPYAINRHNEIWVMAA